LLSPLPSGDYADCHGWQFTPASFELVVLELRALGVIDFHVVRALPTEGCEFCVQLRKGAGDIASEADIEAQRLALLERTVEELGEQADYLRARAGVGRLIWRSRQRVRRLLRPFKIGL
jgi:hypothetical protein